MVLIEHGMPGLFVGGPRGWVVGLPHSEIVCRVFCLP
jgi:hypothetical protein